MKKLIFILALAITLPVFFFSCDDSDDDTTPPKIVVIHINDTLYIDSTTSVNDTVTNRIRLAFFDNHALSTYNFRIKPSRDFVGANDTVKMEGALDSLAYRGVIKSQKADIFGLDTAYISRNLYIQGEFTIYNRETNKNDRYKMRTGKYSVTIDCIDKAGNIDSIQSKDVILLYRP